MLTAASRRPPPLAVALGTVIAAYYALWACAPAATMRAPIPLTPDNPNELALGFAATSGLEESTTSYGNTHGLDVQAWYLRRLGEHAQIGGTLFGGQTSLLGTGFLGRFPIVTRDRFTFGVDVEAGWLWLATGVPMAWRVGDDLWFTTEPSVGWRFNNTFRLPVGLGFEAGPHVVVNPEVYLAYDPLSIYVKQNLTYGAAFSVGTRF